jgi:fumarylacetoacetate (FAA) hydrolase
MGTPAAAALGHVSCCCWSTTCRCAALIPGELEKGFGFFQSKPASELRAGGGRPRTSLATPGATAACTCRFLTFYNGEPFGRPDAGRDMTFSFAELIAHAAHPNLGAGTIIGSGTVSNRPRTEARQSPSPMAAWATPASPRRGLETLRYGAPRTPFMSFGDRVRMDDRWRRGRASSAPSISGWSDPRRVDLDRRRAARRSRIDVRMRRRRRHRHRP